MNRSTAQTEPRPARRETVQSEALYSKVAGRYDTVFERAILAEARLTELAQLAQFGENPGDFRANWGGDLA